MARGRIRRKSGPRTEYFPHSGASPPPAFLSGPPRRFGGRKPLETPSFFQTPVIGTHLSPRHLCRGVDFFALIVEQSSPKVGRETGFHGLRKERRASVQVQVRDNNVDQALRALKKKLQREGVFREMKLRRNFEKPSARKKRERAEAVRRYRKLLRKRMEREGF